MRNGIRAVSLQSAYPCIQTGTIWVQVRMYDVRFILKADDDAFINVPALVRELKAQCQTPGCRKERMYFGKEIRNNVVRLAAGDKWQVRAKTLLCPVMCMSILFL